MKKFNYHIQVWIVLLAFLATVAILFGGKALIAKLQVADPLKKEVFQVKGVRDFSIQPEGEGYKVNLKLKKVTNLQEVLDYIKQKVQFYQNKPVKSMEVADHSNPRLEEVRYQLSFYLEEATSSGRYIQLKEALDSFRGVKASVYLTPDYIYLQLEEGSDYLYRAIPRKSRTVEINNNMGGGAG